MSDESTRRSFLRTAGVAGAALARAPTARHAAAGRQGVLAFVGVGHIHTRTDPQHISHAAQLVTPAEAASRVVVRAAMDEAARTGAWVEVG